MESSKQKAHHQYLQVKPNPPHSLVDKDQFQAIHSHSGARSEPGPRLSYWHDTFLCELVGDSVFCGRKQGW